jgi:D-threo-aldose 1-dehydrogenase
VSAMSRLGLGCAQLGNLYRAMDDERATSTVDAAWDAGVRYFDTAPHYGLGLSEQRLGAALRSRPREQYAVSTKVGRLLEPDPDGAQRQDEQFVVPAAYRRVWDFSRDGVRRSIDESLRRLGLDRIDIGLLHDPEGHPDVAIREGFPALLELRDEGVVGAVGVGSMHVGVLTRVVDECQPDVVLIAGRYTLLEQPALDELLPACVDNHIAVVTAAVFNSGLLAVDRPHGGLPYEYRPAPDDLVARAQAIADVCAEHGTTLPAAALAFAGAHQAVTSVVVGADSPDQVSRNAALFATPPPDALWPALVSAGLLAPRAVAR